MEFLSSLHKSKQNRKSVYSIDCDVSHNMAPRHQSQIAITFWQFNSTDIGSNPLLKASIGLMQAFMVYYKSVLPLDKVR